MDNSNGGGGGGSGHTAAFTISSTLMVAAVIFLFMVIVFVFFLYLYAKRYIAPALARRSGSRARAAFDFSADLGPVVTGHALDAAVLRSLPVKVYSRADFKDVLECAVCLSELADGEEARLLPNCNHGFHVECIDVWFQSHSTCPICRSPVGPMTDGDRSSESAEETLVFPTNNVLFWGSQIEVNARNSAAAPVDSGDGQGEGTSGSSGGSSSRFRPLAKLMSRGKRASGSSYSPRVADIEQGSEGHGEAPGESGLPTPKAPTCSSMASSS